MKWTNPGHEYDKTGERLRRVRDVYIFCADYKDSCHFVLSRLGLRVFFVCSSLENAPDWMKGNVRTLDDFFSQPHGTRAIIVSEVHNEYNDTINLLEAHGCIRNFDYFTYHPGTRTNKFIELYLLYIHDFLMFPTMCLICTTICNLNCDACLVFTQYNKKKRHIPLEELKNSVDALFKQVDYVHLFQISGGEPLLYPYLSDIIGYMGKNYREAFGIFSLVTNSTIMPSDGLCVLCREYNVEVILDDYRPNVDSFPDKIAEKFSAFGVKTMINKVSEWIDLAPFSTDNTGKSEEQLSEHSNACAHPWCELKENMLTSCNYSRFGEEAGISDHDPNNFFDLSRPAVDKKEIYEFRSGYTEKGYLEFCKRCAGFFNNPNHIPAAEQVPNEKR